MVTIILYGDLKDKKITKNLIDYLEGKCNIMHQTPYKMTCYSVKNSLKDVLVIETDILNFVENSQAIFIFKNSISNNINLKINSGINILVNSKNFKAIDFLIQSKFKNIVTYGCFSTDSLTLTDFGDESKILCLQRGIKNLEGDLIEPFEITVSECKVDVDMLPIYGVKILLNL